MKVRISGVTYEIDGINRAGMLDLLELKKQTGLSMKDISEMYNAVQESQKSKDYDFLSDDTGLMLMAVTIWLARRKAGERLTFEEAVNFPLSDMEWIADETESKDESSEPVEAESNPLDSGADESAA